MLAALQGVAVVIWRRAGEVLHQCLSSLPSSALLRMDESEMEENATRLSAELVDDVSADALQLSQGFIPTANAPEQGGQVVGEAYPTPRNPRSCVPQHALSELRSSLRLIAPGKKLPIVRIARTYPSNY